MVEDGDATRVDDVEPVIRLPPGQPDDEYH